VKKFQSYASIATIYHKDIEHFDLKIEKLASDIEKCLQYSELIFVCEVHDVAHLKAGLSNAKSQHPNVDFKIVYTHKRTKHYVFANLAWQAAMGDYLIFSRDFQHLTQYDFEMLAASLGTEHLTYLCKQNHYEPLFSKMNLAYDVEPPKDSLLPQDALGFIISRQAINQSFTNQSEVYDPFIALMLSGLSFQKLYPFDHDAVSKTAANYSLFEQFELLLQFTRFEALESIYKWLALIMSIPIGIVGVLAAFNWASISAFIITLVVLVTLTMVLPLQFANYLLSKHILSAALNKQLAGRMIIERMN